MCNQLRFIDNYFRIAAEMIINLAFSFDILVDFENISSLNSMPIRMIFIWKSIDECLELFHVPSNLASSGSIVVLIILYHNNDAIHIDCFIIEILFISCFFTQTHSNHFFFQNWNTIHLKIRRRKYAYLKLFSYCLC